jgi:hypothetical protein
MMSSLSGLILILAALLAIAAFVMFAEIVVATLTGEKSVPLSGNRERPPVIVLVPAHNEGQAMSPTLKDIKGQLQPSDR